MSSHWRHKRTQTAVMVCGVMVALFTLSGMTVILDGATAELSREYAEALVKSTYGQAVIPARMKFEVESNITTTSADPKATEQVEWFRKARYTLYRDGDKWRADELDYHSLTNGQPDTPPEGANMIWIFNGKGTVYWQPTSRAAQLGAADYDWVLARKDTLTRMADPYKWLQIVCFPVGDTRESVKVVRAETAGPNLTRIIAERFGGQWDVTYDAGQGNMPTLATWRLKTDERSMEMQVSFQYKQAGDGRWIPAHLSVKSAEEPRSPSSDFELEMTVQSVEFPAQDFAQEVFEPVFPQGTEVKDLKRGVRFTVGSPVMTDGSIKKAVGQINLDLGNETPSGQKTGVDPQPVPPAPPATGSAQDKPGEKGWIWAVTAIALVIGGVVVFSVVRRRKSG